jgi:hypothetical protein
MISDGKRWPQAFPCCRRLSCYSRPYSMCLDLGWFFDKEPEVTVVTTRLHSKPRGRGQ